MGIIKGIHHIELVTKSFTSVCDKLMKSFGFQIIASKDKHVILKSGSAVFMVRRSQDQNELDTVYDIALEVDDVAGLVNRAVRCGVHVVKEPETVSDCYGSVDMAQIRSCVGNVSHTIICRKGYKGDFLVGFTKVESKPDDRVAIKMFDHITYVVPRGISDSVIDWYHRVFGMEEFNLNSDDSKTGGFVVRHNNGGMVLKAFDYFKCSEVGVESETCKFIIAEEIDGNVPSQIGTFLREHGGAGVQHVGMLVDDIVASAQRFHSDGAQFLTHPTQYYRMMHDRLPVDRLNLPVAALERYGILADSEQRVAVAEGDATGTRYLLQAFTRPIFDRETFFLELIERHGATGFGSGNVRALWDAVEAAMASGRY